MKVSKKLFLVSIISLIVFIFVLIEVLNNGFLTKLDITINSIISILENDLFVDISNILGFIFDTLGVIIISLIFSGCLWIKKHKRDSIFFIIVILINSLFIFLIKELVQRTRPLNSLIQEGSFAFPSGHAATSVVFFGLLIYLSLRKIKSDSLRLIIIILSIFMIIIISMTRLILNVHWFSDVIGGIFLGLFILTGSIIIKRKFKYG